MALTATEELEYITLMEAELRHRARRKIDSYFPDDGPYRRELYPKHIAFFAAGATHAMRLFCKANRVGGTEGMGCELTYHLTGEYPEWWVGYRFDYPIVAWVAGDTNPKTQEIIQAKLFGSKDSSSSLIGTGIIPGEALRKVSTRPGVPGAIQTAEVQHASGGVSTVTLKSFEQGHESFQGNEVHVIWLDELAPLPVLSECVVRITATSWFEGGMLAWTVTPEEGLTDAIMEFLPDGQFPDEPQAPPKFTINATWDDVPHLSDEAKATLEAGIPAYQLDARSRGVPALGAGVVYPVPEDRYLCEPFELPPYWPRAYALDVGWNRTAALWGAYDREVDCWYLYYEYYMGEAEPSVHASGIKAPGDWIRGVIDPAARGRSQIDGQRLMQMYRDLGLVLMPAQNAVEAGIYQVWERMSTGRLKVFETLQHWRKEVRLYRRDKKGHIVKTDDHLMDDTRYLLMSGQNVAQVKPVASEQGFREQPMYGATAWMGG